MFTNIKAPKSTPTPKEQATLVPVNPYTEVADRLIGELPRQAGETIRATHIVGDNYRVNWYAKSKGDSFIETFRISRSRFMSATIEDGKLLIP